jgi:hypothetical protein
MGIREFFFTPVTLSFFQSQLQFWRWQWSIGWKFITQPVELDHTGAPYFIDRSRTTDSMRIIAIIINVLRIVNTDPPSTFLHSYTSYCLQFLVYSHAGCVVICRRKGNYSNKLCRVRLFNIRRRNASALELVGQQRHDIQRRNALGVLAKRCFSQEFVIANFWCRELGAIPTHVVGRCWKFENCIFQCYMDGRRSRDSL